MNTYQRLKEILVHEYDVAPDKVTLDASLEQIGLDSLGVMELMFRVEEVFGIRIPHEESSLRTVQDVADFIERLQGAGQPDDAAVDKSGQTAVNGAA